jgi:hypothetical protein
MSKRGPIPYNLIPIVTKLPSNEIERLEILRGRRYLSRSALIRELVRQGLERELGPAFEPDDQDAKETEVAA